MSYACLSRFGACGLVLFVGCQTASTPAADADDVEGDHDSADSLANPPATDLGELRAACPPSDLFQRALCVCEDLRDVGLLTVREGAGGTGSVGVNGRTKLINAMHVAGSFDAYESFSAIAAAEVGGSLSTTGDANWTGALSVGGDFAVGGDVKGIGLLAVEGALRVQGSSGLIGLTTGTRAHYEPPTQEPCPCDPERLFDVSAAIDAARRDDATIQLDERLQQVGITSITLDAGAYYVGDAKSIGILDLDITGHVALYVDGRIDSIGVEHVHLADGASFDLYARGLGSIGVQALGHRDDSSRMRFFVGGKDAVVLSIGAQVFHGALYAPEASVAYVGSTDVVGGLFARELTGVGRLNVVHGLSATNPDGCEPPADEDAGVPPDEESDAGLPGDGEPDGDEDAGPIL